MTAPVLVFDIETVPDVEGLRKLNNLGKGVTDSEVAEMAFQSRKESTGKDFLPLHLQKVVAISCALRDYEKKDFRIWSLGSINDPEDEIIRRFFEGISKYTPQLVSWNGSGFDLPVLNYRGLLHGIQAHKYWDMGEDDKEFKWNNYLSRYHSRHLDMMDILAMYQARANAPLNDLAVLMGLPGKLGMDGSQVWTEYKNGGIVGIRNYCETDVVNTYLVYLRFQFMRGELKEQQFLDECYLVQDTLKRSSGPHWKEFLNLWDFDDQDIGNIETCPKNFYK